MIKNERLSFFESLLVLAASALSYKNIFCYSFIINYDICDENEYLL